MSPDPFFCIFLPTTPKTNLMHAIALLLLIFYITTVSLLLPLVAVHIVPQCSYIVSLVAPLFHPFFYGNICFICSLG